jgi:hypothetical protein
LISPSNALFTGKDPETAFYILEEIFSGRNKSFDYAVNQFCPAVTDNLIMRGIFPIRNKNGILKKFFGAGPSRKANLGITEQSLYIGNRIQSWARHSFKNKRSVLNANELFWLHILYLRGQKFILSFACNTIILF